MPPRKFRRDKWAYLGYAIVLAILTFLTFRPRFLLATEDYGLRLVMIVGVCALSAIGTVLMTFKGPEEKD
jgi:hypothetical protein